MGTSGSFFFAEGGGLALGFFGSWKDWAAGAEEALGVATGAVAGCRAGAKQEVGSSFCGLWVDFCGYVVEVAYMEYCSGGENEANMQGTSFTFLFSADFYAYSSWLSKVGLFVSFALL